MIVSMIKRHARADRRLYAVLRRLLGAWRAFRKGVRQAHPTSYLSASCVVSPDLVLDAHSYIGPNCRVCSGVSIGKYSMLGPGVSIVGADHNYQVVGVPMIFAGRPPQVRTVIEDDVWIGCNAIVLAGNKVGRGAIVAAGSVVTRPVPDFSVVAGVPARVISTRFDSESDRAAHSQVLNGPTISGDYCP